MVVRGSWGDQGARTPSQWAITRVVAPEVEDDLIRLADQAPASVLERIIAGCRRQLTEMHRWADGVPDAPTEVREVRRVEVTPEVIEFRIRLGTDDAAAFEQRLDRPSDRSGEDRHLVVLQVDADQLAAATTDPDGADRDTDPGRSDVSAETSPTPRQRVHLISGHRRSMTLPPAVLARLTCDTNLRIVPIHTHANGGDTNLDNLVLLCLICG